MAMNKRLVLSAVSDATDAIQDALATCRTPCPERDDMLKALGIVMALEQELKEDLGV